MDSFLKRERSSPVNNLLILCLTLFTKSCKCGMALEWLNYEKRFTMWFFLGRNSPGLAKTYLKIMFQTQVYVTVTQSWPESQHMQSNLCSSSRKQLTGRYSVFPDTHIQYLDSAHSTVSYSCSDHVQNHCPGILTIDQIYNTHLPYCVHTILPQMLMDIAFD